jgi:hypothetical protein
MYDFKLIFALENFKCKETSKILQLQWHETWAILSPMKVHDYKDLNEIHVSHKAVIIKPAVASH